MWLANGRWRKDMRWTHVEISLDHLARVWLTLRITSGARSVSHKARRLVHALLGIRRDWFHAEFPTHSVIGPVSAFEITCGSNALRLIERVILAASDFIQAPLKRFRDTLSYDDDPCRRGF